MRKFIVLCSCLMLVVLAGCSQPPKPSNKILLWHWMTDRNDTFQKLAQQYKQETGIEVIYSVVRSVRFVFPESHCRGTSQCLAGYLWHSR